MLAACIIACRVGQGYWLAPTLLRMEYLVVVGGGVRRTLLLALAGGVAAAAVRAAVWAGLVGVEAWPLVWLACALLAGVAWRLGVGPSWYCSLSGILQQQHK
jgi:hypothetical protein